MTPEDRQIGTWVVLMERYTRYHLPRARRWLERVENGERVSDEGLAYLREAVVECRETLALLEMKPVYTTLFTRPVVLYAQIIELALKNEIESEESPASY